jgi:hypothetical protein
MAAEFGANWRVTATLVIASTPCRALLLGTPENIQFCSALKLSPDAVTAPYFRVALFLPREEDQ